MSRRAKSTPPIAVVRLTGGLGNQMFQYAFGRRFALACGGRLKFDGTQFTEDRPYSLGRLRVQVEFATQEELQRFFPPQSKALLRISRLLPLRVAEALPASSVISCLSRLRWPRHRVHFQREFGYDVRVFGVRPPCYLAGHWQSERYFRPITDLLRLEFAPAVPLRGADATVAAEVEGTNSVSLHVRRGDYLLPTNLARIGTCSLDYYRAAVTLVASRSAALGHGPPTLFVFSDDIPWARSNLEFAFATRFVDHNDQRGNVEDLLLMSLCRHHILANSSLSWWAAWLGSGPDRLVVAPRRWTIDPVYDDRDVHLGGWTLL